VNGVDEQASVRPFSPESVRADFPILDQLVNGQPLVYLDNAATTQKPEQVIDAISHFYRTINSNVHRGAHQLSDRATEAFENARKTVAAFINSPGIEQIIWTRGTTEAANLVASSWGRDGLSPGDKVLVSTMEHHSNIVPWQMLAERTGAQVVPIPISEKGEIDLKQLSGMLAEGVKLLAVNHVSNALGTVNPIREIVSLAKAQGVVTFVDGAQAVSHFPVDVQAIGCDFYAFSGHKVFAPTGIGVLWGRKELLEAMPPYHGGGEMIESCRFSGTTYNKLPYKFEAGTPDIAGAIGLAVALDYLQSFDRNVLSKHEADLLRACHQRAEACEGLRRVGEAKHIAGVFSFLLEGAHPSDVGMLLDQQGIAVRTGHHCAQPLMEYFSIPGTVRASFSIYNTLDDVDRLFAAIEKVKQFL